MNAQLARIEREFASALDRLHALARDVPSELWFEPPSPGRWSAADCVEHLNRTAEAFLPSLREALAKFAGDRDPRRTYRRDALGWVLSVVMPPPVRLMRVRTSKAFEPLATTSREQLVARFEELQAEQVRALHDADGLPLNRIRIRSPFDERVSYNLYSCFVILPRHQHRHLWQAEEAVAELRGKIVA